MKQLLVLSIILWLSSAVKAQDNCNVFLWEGDSCRYAACRYLQEAPNYFQLTDKFHLIYDTAIMICPNYSDIYREKSTAYLKTGDWITWKELMDKAVELNPTEHLGYRGWCKFQFLRDYEGAIQDLERLDALIDYDLGQSQNGMYHLQIALALCYKMIGQPQKAIELIKNHLAKADTYVGNFDYLHLGVLYLEKGELGEAQAAFAAQEEINKIAETAYYQAQRYEQLGDEKAARKALTIALKRYLNHRMMYDPYTHQVDKIYLAQIEESL
ncbi:MAG: hypothetical protein AAF806_29980 [Bacteroidota bacterium]